MLCTMQQEGGRAIILDMNSVLLGAMTLTQLTHQNALKVLVAGWLKHQHRRKKINPPKLSINEDILFLST
jgi:hypothetical protein